MMTELMCGARGDAGASRHFMKTPNACARETEGERPLRCVILCD